MSVCLICKEQNGSPFSGPRAPTLTGRSAGLPSLDASHLGHFQSSFSSYALFLYPAVKHRVSSIPNTTGNNMNNHVMVITVATLS